MAPDEACTAGDEVGRTHPISRTRPEMGRSKLLSRTPRPEENRRRPARGCRRPPCAHASFLRASRLRRRASSLGALEILVDLFGMICERRPRHNQEAAVHSHAGKERKPTATRARSPERFGPKMCEPHGYDARLRGESRGRKRIFTFRVGRSRRARKRPEARPCATRPDTGGGGFLRGRSPVRAIGPPASFL